MRDSRGSDLSTGDGIYKSVDAGRTWTHLGLHDAQQIPQIVVDPHDADRLFVAVLGHPYGPSEERGIFRSTDGGSTFTKVLYKDADTGGADVALDPANAQTVYAVLWQSRQAPWDEGAVTGAGSGLFKSTDGGATWRPIMNGLPTFEHDGLGRIGIAVAPSLPQRLFATVEARTDGGLYRSDDAGATWRLASASPGVAGSPAFAQAHVDPRNPDIVYTTSGAAWRSVDGGRTFTAWAGAPGGDGYHRLWINPNDTNTMLLAGARGAAITVNGGRTWSSRYNQPTAEFSHVATDASLPYRVCGAQQASGSGCVVSQSDAGRITIRDWQPVGSDDYGDVAPDPLDPDVVYSGRLSRFDRRTAQTQDVLPPRDASFRAGRMAPLLFSAIDSRTLFFAANALWKTANGGQNWTAISPDLAREAWDAPASLGAYRSSPAARPARRGVISAVALFPDRSKSPLGWHRRRPRSRDAGRRPHLGGRHAAAARTLGQGLDAGRLAFRREHRVRRGQRVPARRPAPLRLQDAGRGTDLDARDDGLPDDAPVNTVKEDPQRRGLLFAGTERAVHVSFDDGDHWQSLRLEMPATSIRDLAIKDDDLVVATHGRGFWILGDITPLRQITTDVVRTSAFLFRPPTAWRFRSNSDGDAWLPPDEPGAPNPPDGVVISYLLGPNVTGPVTLEILETTSGLLIRRYSSDSSGELPTPGSGGPDASRRLPSRLATGPGLHRFVWDVRFAPPAVDAFDFPAAGPLREIENAPRGLWVLPGTYQVRLTVGGRAYRQAVLVKMDPRVKTSAADLTAQFKLSKALDDAIRELHGARRALEPREAAASGAGTDQLRAIARALDDAYGPLPALLASIQESDARPTAALEAAATAALQRAADALARYKDTGTG